MVSPPGGAGLPSIAIQLLGTFQVTIDGRAVEPRAWKLRKATELVKRLALAHGHQLHRDQLVDQMWPDIEGDWASASFHQALHAARRAVEPQRANRAIPSLLPLRHQVLALAPDQPLWIDAEVFLTETARARSAGDLAACLAALDHYTGDLLPEDLYEDWIQAPREALRSAYIGLLGTTAQLQELSGSVDDAITTLHTLVGVDPLNESAHASLLRLLAMTGRREQAQRLYEQLRERLHDQLAAEPAPEMVELIALINAGAFATQLIASHPSPSPAATPVTSVSPAAARPSISLIDRARQAGFVSRTSELDQLQAAFDAVLTGQGQIVLLAGEPGIGKTRLAEEMADYAETAGAHVFWARCHDTEGAPAFWLWSQIVRASLRGMQAEELRTDLGAGLGPIAQVVPELRTLFPDAPSAVELDPQQARFRFFDSLTEYLSHLASRQPLVLVIDDLQWADPSSVLLFEFFTDHLASQRILLLATYREVEARQQRAVTQALGRISRSRATLRLQLPGLDPDATAELGERIAGQALPVGLISSIQQRTDGNPLFVRELASLLAEEREGELPSTPGRWGAVVPVGVREAVSLRLQQLSAATGAVLATAAIIGATFQLDVLASVATVTIDDLLDQLDEAVAFDMIVPDFEDINRFRFSHGLIQEAIKNQMLGPRQARLHARIGEVLARLHGDDPDPPFAEIAEHFVQTAGLGEAEKAISFSIRAGEQAMARLAFTEAANQFQQAVTLLGRHGSDRSVEMADALHHLGQAQRASGDPDTSQATLQRAVDLARDSGDLERQITVGFELIEAIASLITDHGVSEIRRLRVALDSLPDEDTPLRARAMSRLALYLSILHVWHVALETDVDDPDPARMAEEALAMAQRMGIPAVVADALHSVLEIPTERENLEQRFDNATQLLTIAEMTGMPDDELNARSVRIEVLLRTGRIGELDDELAAYDASATQYQLPLYRWLAASKAAMRTQMRGDLEDAETLIEQSRELGQIASPDISLMAYLLQLFFLRREQDRLDEIEESLAAVAARQPGLALWQGLLAMLYAERGQTEQASTVVATVLAPGASAIPRSSLWLASLALLGEVCATTNDRLHAASLLPLLAPFEDQYISPGQNHAFLGPIAHFLGLLAGTLERVDEASSYFDHALRMESVAGTPVLQVQTQCAYADLLMSRTDRLDDAGRLLDAAQETAGRLRLVRSQRIVNALQAKLMSCHSP